MHSLSLYPTGVAGNKPITFLPCPRPPPRLPSAESTALSNNSQNQAPLCYVKYVRRRIGAGPWQTKAAGTQSRTCLPTALQQRRCYSTAIHKLYSVLQHLDAHPTVIRLPTSTLAHPVPVTPRHTLSMPALRFTTIQCKTATRAHAQCTAKSSKVRLGCAKRSRACQLLAAAAAAACLSGTAAAHQR